MCLGPTPKHRRKAAAIVKLQLSADAAFPAQQDSTQNHLGSEQIVVEWASSPIMARQAKAEADHDSTPSSAVSPLTASQRTASTVSETDSEDEASLISSTRSSVLLPPPPLKSCLKTAPDSINNNDTVKSVRFDQVHIRIYNRMMGDYSNSWCGSLPPLILSGYDYTVPPPTSVDKFEAVRSLDRRPKVNGSFPSLDVDERRRILIDKWGYTKRQVKRREKQIEALKEKDAKAKRIGYRPSATERFKRLLLSARAE